MAQLSPDQAPHLLHALPTIETLIFDLDGTLYTGDEHYWRFARRFAEHIDPQRREAFLADVSRIMQANHPIRPGLAFDPESRVLFEQTPSGWRCLRRADGSALPHLVQPPELLEPMGDPWAAIRSLAVLYDSAWNGPREDIYAIRDGMLEADFPLGPIEGLAPVLRRLKGHLTLALVSDAPIAQNLGMLEKLDLLGLFDMHRPEAKKPGGLDEAIDALTQGQPDARQVLAFGDKYALDLEPVIRRGGYGVLLNPWTVQPHAAHLHLRQHHLVVPLLEQLAAAHGL